MNNAANEGPECQAPPKEVIAEMVPTPMLRKSKDAAAAELNISRRDIKPANLMLTENGAVKIADLGMAKRLAGTGESDASVDGITVGQDGAAIRGTPAYMAPEIVLDPVSVDARVDLYSLGATAYEMITGQPPFRGKTPVDTMMQHVHKAPRPISELVPEIPYGLASIIMRLLEKKPDNRYRSAQELVAALEAIK